MRSSRSALRRPGLWLAALLALAAPAQAAPPKNAPKPAGPVAHVNGTAIPQADFDRALRMVMERSGHAGQQLDASALRTGVMEQLIHRELLYQASLKKPPKDLNQKVDAEFKTIQGRFPTPEQFRNALKADGLTEAGLKELVRKQLSVADYVETQIAPTVKPPDAEKFYKENSEKFRMEEQVRASHVLIQVPQGAAADQKKKALSKAKEIQKRAAKGEDFAKLARENSQDPGSAANGGDLGFFPRKQMVEPFAKAAFALKPGQVSDVVETPFGYHVIKVAEHKPAGKQPFSEVKERLGEYLKARALDEAIKKRLGELEKQAKITIELPAK